MVGWLVGVVQSRPEQARMICFGGFRVCSSPVWGLAAKLSGTVGGLDTDYLGSGEGWCGAGGGRGGERLGKGGGGFLGEIDLFALL